MVVQEVLSIGSFVMKPSRRTHDCNPRGLHLQCYDTSSSISKSKERRCAYVFCRSCYRMECQLTNLSKQTHYQGEPPTNLRAVTGPAFWYESMARMYITLLILLGALNSIVTVVDLPALVRLKVFVGWQLVAEYSGWQFT